MSDFNKLKAMTADYKRFAFGKLWFWRLNRAWKATFRVMGLMK